MSGLPRVVVLVISWNRPDLTLRCVRSLVRLDYPCYELAIVENGGAQAAASLRRQLPQVPVVASPTNLGFAGGSNLGLAYARRRGADYVLLLNNDTVVPADALSGLVELAQAHKEVGLLSPTIRYLAAPHRIWFRGSRLLEHGVRVVLAPFALPAGVPRLPGLAALIRRQQLRMRAALDPGARARLLGLRDYSLRFFGAGPTTRA